jgi:hypothetical protein
MSSRRVQVPNSKRDKGDGLFRIRILWRRTIQADWQAVRARARVYVRSTRVHKSMAFLAHFKYCLDQTTHPLRRVRIRLVTCGDACRCDQWNQSRQQLWRANENSERETPFDDLYNRVSEVRRLGLIEMSDHRSLLPSSLVQKVVRPRIQSRYLVRSHWHEAYLFVDYVSLKTFPKTEA